MARVKGEHGYGFINSNFELAIPCKYSEASNFSGGASVVIYEGRKGFIDIKGSFHAVDVDMIYPFSDGVAKVRKTDRYGDKYGYINKKGVFIVPCEYDEVLDFMKVFALSVSDTKLMVLRTGIISTKKETNLSQVLLIMRRVFQTVGQEL